MSKDQALITMLLRQTDKLQNKWGFPPSPLIDTLPDLVPQEFAAIWSNVDMLSTTKHVLEATNLNTSESACKKSRFRFSRVIPIMYYPRMSSMKKTPSKKAVGQRNHHRKSSFSTSTSADESCGQSEALHGSFLFVIFSPCNLSS